VGHKPDLEPGTSLSWNCLHHSKCGACWIRRGELFLIRKLYLFKEMELGPNSPFTLTLSFHRHFYGTAYGTFFACFSCIVRTCLHQHPLVQVGLLHWTWVVVGTHTVREKEFLWVKCGTKCYTTSQPWVAKKQAHFLGCWNATLVIFHTLIHTFCLAIWLWVIGGAQPPFHLQCFEAGLPHVTCEYPVSIRDYGLWQSIPLKKHDPWKHERLIVLYKSEQGEWNENL